MKKSELANILRAACDVTKDPEILVIGSQAILASFSEDELPRDATLSIEADVAFLDDPDERKSDAVDGAIGEESTFHESFGIYGQGVRAHGEPAEGLERATCCLRRSRSRREYGRLP